MFTLQWVVLYYGFVPVLYGPRVWISLTVDIKILSGKVPDVMWDKINECREDSPMYQ